MKYLGWVDGEGNFTPHAGVFGAVGWRPSIGYLEEHEDGRVDFVKFGRIISTYPDLDTALVAVRLKLS